MTEDMIPHSALLYKEKAQQVHISTKKFRFYNGVITYVGADFLMIQDEKLGEMPLFFQEIDTIEPWRAKGGKEDGWTGG